MDTTNTSYSSQQPLDDQTADFGKFIIGFVFTGLFCMVGLIVNVFVCLVVLQIKVLCRYMWYLLSLTFFDWFICLAAIFHLVIPAFCFYFQPAILIHFINGHPVIGIAVNYVYSTLQCSEIWITVALTSDRFWLISQPFESGSLFDKRRTKKTICVVSIVAIIYNIPRIIFMSYNQENNDDKEAWQNNTSVATMTDNSSEVLQWISPDTHCVITHDFTGTWVYCFLYNVVLNWLLLHILPTLALCVYNLKLFRKVRNAKRHLCAVSTMKNAKKDSLWATINIIALVIFFIICQTPTFIFKICLFCDITTDRDGMFYQVTQLILVVNAAMNFVVYFLIFGLFRRLAMSFLCGYGTGKEQTDQVSQTCSSNNFTRRSRPVNVKYTHQQSHDSSFRGKPGKITRV